MADILSAANWSRESTFQRFYSKRVKHLAFAQAILGGELVIFSTLNIHCHVLGCILYNFGTLKLLSFSQICGQIHTVLYLSFH